MTDEKLYFYPYKIINENTKLYLYNIITNGIYEINDVDKYIINKASLNDVEQVKFIEEVNFMKDHFIIKTEDNMIRLNDIYSKSLEKRLKKAPSSVTLMISQDCNLRCSYCYGESGVYKHKGMMKEETAQKAIDYLVKFSKQDHLNVCFFGGEPLLNFELMKKIVSYCKEIERNSSKRFDFSMTTNGTLINKEVEEFIISNRVSTTVSIDGNETEHNVNRYYANKQGCYRDVISKTEHLRAKQLVVARATLSNQNVDVFTSIQHLVNLGFQTVNWAYAFETIEDAYVDKIIESEKNIVLHMEKLIKRGEIKEARKYGTAYKYLKRLKTDSLQVKGCGTGTGMIAVNIDGEIYPCHRFVGETPMKLGNINDSTIYGNQTFENNIDINKFKKCQDCIARNVCVGGCVHDNIDATGDLKDAPENICRITRSFVEELIKLYIRLDNMPY